VAALCQNVDDNFEANAASVATTSGSSCCKYRYFNLKYHRVIVSDYFGKDVIKIEVALFSLP
jgi:hypothetical protein